MIDLQWLLCLSYLTNAGLAVFLASSGRRFRGAWLWVGAQCLLALGTLGDVLPPSAPSWIPLVVGNSAYTASCVLYLHSVWSFRFKPPFPWVIYLAIPAQMLMFSLALGQPYWVRAEVFAVWMGTGTLGTAALLLWRVEARFRLTNGLAALPFVLLGLASWVRVFMLAAASQLGEVSPDSGLNVWSVAGAILLSTITLFGYFMMTVLQDIEERNRQLVEASRNKDLFFAIVAHDLRGPVSGSARYVRKHLLGKMTGFESKASEMTTLAESLERTHEFLEKLVWWTRAQLDGWSPQPKGFSLNKAVAEVVEVVAPFAVAKTIHLEVVTGTELEAWADPESVGVIVSALVSNAIKYSHPGQTVTLELALVGQECRLSVIDSGVGLSEAAQARLFHIEDKFSTLGTASEGGAGMGLILARTLAEGNRGRLELESTERVGTRVSLWIPVRAGSHQVRN